MSCRSRSYKFYNRAENKEELHWTDMFTDEHETDYWYCCEECDSPWFSHYDFYGYGWVSNMDEYHTMRVLTLLRSLNIRTAGAEATDRGW